MLSDIPLYLTAKGALRSLRKPLRSLRLSAPQNRDVLEYQRETCETSDRDVLEYQRETCEIADRDVLGDHTET